MNPLNKTNAIHNFTGTLTKLENRLENYDEIMNNYNETGKLDISPIPKENSIPIDRIDQAAMQHDIDYISKDLKDRHVNDFKMRHQINNISNPTLKEKLERSIVKSNMKGKIMLGQGLERHAKNNSNKKIFKNGNEYDEKNNEENIEKV